MKVSGKWGTPCDECPIYRAQFKIHGKYTGKHGKTRENTEKHGRTRQNTGEHGKLKPTPTAIFFDLSFYKYKRDNRHKPLLIRSKLVSKHKKTPDKSEVFYTALCLQSVVQIWRCRPELNRCTRFCRPLRNHSATAPFYWSPR